MDENLLLAQNKVVHRSSWPRIESVCAYWPSIQFGLAFVGFFIFKRNSIINSSIKTSLDGFGRLPLGDSNLLYGSMQRGVRCMFNSLIWEITSNNSSLFLAFTAERIDFCQRLRKWSTQTGAAKDSELLRSQARVEEALAIPAPVGPADVLVTFADVCAVACMRKPPGHSTHQLAGKCEKF